jgi:hypothetical protein
MYLFLPIIFLEEENKYMITGIVIIEKGNAKRMYITNPKDWLNPDINIINTQIPYIGGTEIIDKSNYETESISEENGEEYFISNETEI